MPDVARVFDLPKPKLQHRPDGGHGVAKPDLLPFLVGPAVVGDRDLVNAIAPAGDLRGDLRLDAEAGDSSRIDWMTSRRNAL